MNKGLKDRAGRLLSDFDEAMKRDDVDVIEMQSNFANDAEQLLREVLEAKEPRLVIVIEGGVVRDIVSSVDSEKIDVTQIDLDEEVGDQVSEPVVFLSVDLDRYIERVTNI